MTANREELNAGALSGFPDRPRLRASRIPELEMAKGIGITLVVLGHILASSSVGPEWYVIMKRLIYQFHMPFFLFLSGLAFAWVRNNYLDLSYFRYASRRANRLLVPFFAFGFFILLVKYAFQHVIHVDYPPDEFWSGLTNLFLNTDQSPARSIWYLFTLFLFSVAVFPMEALSKSKLVLLMLAGIVLFLIPVPDILYLDRAAYFFIFFVLGLWAGQYYGTFRSFLERTGMIWVLIFGLVCIVLLYMNVMTPWTKLVGGLSSLTGLLYIAMKLRGPFASLFGFLGTHSLSIYLMNTLAIGGFKAFFIILVSSVGSNFGIFFVGATLAGILLPIAIYLLLDRYSPRAARYLH